MAKKLLSDLAFCVLIFLFGVQASSQTPAPVPSSVYTYYCQNDVAVPLSASGISGGEIRWYTSSTAVSYSLTAPTPLTTTAATVTPLTYYVTQVVGGVESSPRTEVYVFVGKQLGLYCQTVTANSITFDFANVGQTSFSYSYTVNGGAPITGTITSPSNFTVTGLNENERVIFTLTAIGAGSCVSTMQASCSTVCRATTITLADFPTYGPFCAGDVAPSLPTTSPNGISGIWSPSVIDNIASGTYTFIPDAILFPCASTITRSIVVNPTIVPFFSTVPTVVCQNTTAPILPTTSSNSIGVTGTWSPNIISTSVIGTVNYTFTPDSGQCTSNIPTTITITTRANNTTPGFAAIRNVCDNEAPYTLEVISPNGITGSWSPAIVDTTTPGSYVFTADPDQCASNQIITTNIITAGIPDFGPIAPICFGDVVPILASVSPNGFTGSWFPATIDNTISATYLFTPDSGQCANTQTIFVDVEPLVVPDFNSFSVCEGSVGTVLSSSSPNGISGTWLPATVDTTVSQNYTFTPDFGQCATSQTINVSILPSNTLADFTWTVSAAFEENQIVAINATDSGGSYLYQIDDGAFQTNTEFQNVSTGFHTVTVIDQTGCSVPISKDNVLVVNYKKFFTPNGDGYNDTWNISELASQTNAAIYIFDRYGKLIKKLSPSGTGWDGTWNGKQLPSTDYWFSVDYTEDGRTQQFKAHFSLKR